MEGVRVSPEWVLGLAVFAACNLLSALAWYRFQMRMARRFGPEILDKTKDLRPPAIRIALPKLPSARPAPPDIAALPVNGDAQPPSAAE